MLWSATKSSQISGNRHLACAEEHHLAKRPQGLAEDYGKASTPLVAALRLGWRPPMCGWPLVGKSDLEHLRTLLVRRATILDAAITGARMAARENSPTGRVIEK
jgi:hypothetical protein